MDNESLEKLKLICVTYLDEEIGKDIVAPRSIHLSPYQSFLHDRLCIELIQEIYGRQADKVHYRYPADWWQAFKQRFAPEWIKRRWPVRETELTVDVKLLYPKGIDQAPIIHVLVFKDGLRIWFEGYDGVVGETVNAPQSGGRMSRDNV